MNVYTLPGSPFSVADNSAYVVEHVIVLIDGPNNLFWGNGVACKLTCDCVPLQLTYTGEHFSTVSICFFNFFSLIS